MAIRRRENDNAKPDHKLIDHFLRKKSITWVEAADLYRVRSLTRRIADIRAKGMPIISEWRRDLNGQRCVVSP